jgi:hypothetical protein
MTDRKILTIDQLSKFMEDWLNYNLGNKPERVTVEAFFASLEEAPVPSLVCTCPFCSVHRALEIPIQIPIQNKLCPICGELNCIKTHIICSEDHT